MTPARTIVFLVNLLQDVNVLRPLAYLAAREFDAGLCYLVSLRFLERDSVRVWQKELSQIAVETGGTIHLYDSPADAVAVMQGKSGIVIAASESSLSTHADTHNVLRVAPSSFLKVTLQHGYECVGFLQNREHIVAHGRNIKFAADVVCGWCEAPALTSLPNTEKPKLYVSGPPSVLNVVPKRDPGAPSPGGLICENLHSARLRATGDHGKSFMDNFAKFCAALDEKGENVTLRPHPGGMYVVKNKVELPANVQLNANPMYKVDLGAYAYGISAPSTIVLDMVLAGIPVGVWRDEEGIMDASNYDGLTPVSGLDSWFELAREAAEDREAILARQKKFLSRLSMPTDPKDVYSRFARLFAGGMPSIGSVTTAKPAPEPGKPPRRISFVANGPVPTLQLWFMGPLAPLIESGEIVYDLVTEVDFNADIPFKKNGRMVPDAERHAAVGDWLEKRLAAFKPDLVVACRYSAPAADRIVSYAKSAGVPLIFHIDDDLLNVPRELGEKKFLAHNHPNRLRSVDTLLRNADLVYCSTQKMKKRLRQLSYRGPIETGRISCSGRVINRAVNRPVTRVGYMGFDHAHDFRVMLGQLVRYLRRNTDVEFELFGSIPKPDELLEFGDRIHMIEPVRNYDEFMQVFASRQWDIGLCPLASTLFNQVKSVNKWVEYTCVGAAALCTKGILYDNCASDGCGMLLGDDEWLDAMEYLTDNPEKRYEMVARAQARLEESYTPEIFRAQVLDAFALARRLKDQPADEWPHAPSGTFALHARPAAERFL